MQCVLMGGFFFFSSQFYLKFSLLECTGFPLLCTEPALPLGPPGPRSPAPRSSPSTSSQSSELSSPCVVCFVTCCPVAQQCLTLCNPMDCSTPGFPSFSISQSLLKLKSIEGMMPSNHLLFCGPLLLLPSIFARIRVLSNESALHIRWAKYCNLRSLLKY